MIAIGFRTRRWMLGIASLCAAWLLASAGAAERRDFVPYKPDLAARSCCAVPIAQIHPTQMAVGYREVEMRASKLGTMGKAKLEKYRLEKVAPIVIGPGGVPYLLDHHHLARALLASGASLTLYCQVRENWAALDRAEFWKRMKEKSWVYLLDEKGEGPVDPEALPATVEGLRDDPYRSLAWMVRQRNGYDDSDVLFADFQWANFLRKRVKAAPSGGTFEEAVQEALRLVHAPEAAALPGYKAQ